MEVYRIRITCFLILIFSIVLVASQGISSSYLNKSWAGKVVTLDNEKIEDEGDSGNDEETPAVSSEDRENANQTVNDLNEEPLTSEGDNQTVNDMTDQALSGEEVSKDDNQTTTGVPGETESNQNSNQSIETENQTQNSQEVNIQNNIQMKQKLDIIISEEEGEAPIPLEDQNRIESNDRVIEAQHKALTGPDCRSGNVLAGASNAEDLRVISECQDATGTVMHTKKMDDGDFKFFLNLDEKSRFLANEKSKKQMGSWW